MTGLMVAAWVFAPVLFSNAPPVYFATKAACVAYAEARAEADKRTRETWRCFATGAAQ